MSQNNKKIKKRGRPRIYSDPKQKHIEANKRHPRIRCKDPEEKDIFLWIRERPELYKRVKEYKRTGRIDVPILEKVENKVVPSEITINKTPAVSTKFTNVPDFFALKKISYNHMCEIIDTKGYKYMKEYTGIITRNKKRQWRKLCQLGLAM